tara:strand:- start:8 stop:367 length:360 start_codon:yes stop_codon:yes gene_type:complete
MFDVPKCLEQQWTTLFGAPVAVAGKEDEEDEEDEEEEDAADGAPASASNAVPSGPINMVRFLIELLIPFSPSLGQDFWNNRAPYCWTIPSGNSCAFSRPPGATNDGSNFSKKSMVSLHV